MTVQTCTVTIDPGPLHVASSRAQRIEVTVPLAGPDIVVGDSGVTATAGTVVAAGSTQSFDLAGGQVAFAVTAAGSVAVLVDPKPPADAGPAPLTRSSTLSPLNPSSVLTDDYDAQPGDLVVADTSGAAIEITLPETPADRTQIAIKLVVAGHDLTITAAGADRFNLDGGPVSLVRSTVDEGAMLQYSATLALWYVLDANPAIVPMAFVADPGAPTVDNDVEARAMFVELRDGLVARKLMDPAP